MKNLFPSRMLAMDNEVEGEAELIRAEIDLFNTMSQHSGMPPSVCREIFAAYPKKSWLDAVPWGWRLVAVVVFGYLVWLYGSMAGAW